MTESWSIVVGIDGSGKDEQSTLWAARTVSRTGGRVQLLHSPRVPVVTHGVELPEEELVGLARSVTEQAAERVRATFPDVEVTTDVVLEDPAVALVAASQGADLVVVGARGLGRISSQFLGSVSQKVAAQAACPVVVAHGEPRNPDGDVTVGIDPGDPIPEVLDLAYRLAAQRGVGVHLVYAFPPTPSELGYTRIRHLLAQAARERAQELQDFADRWQRRHPDVQVRASEVHGQPADALIELLPGAGLVVLGSRGRRGLSGRHLGSVAQRVLHHAPLAVIVPVPA